MLKNISRIFGKTFSLPFVFVAVLFFGTAAAFGTLAWMIMPGAKKDSPEVLDVNVLLPERV